MDRIIKFRAWDKKNSKWIYIDFVNHRVWSKELLEKISDGEITFEFDSRWQQFTGLKDKNGKDIYEGDIVKRNGDISEISFDMASFYINGELEWMDMEDLNKCEVIGNIFENHNLLTN